MSDKQTQGKCCKTCVHLMVEPDKSGRRVVRTNNVYTCAFDPPMPALPDSITLSYGFRWPPKSRHMRGNEGTDCPVWNCR